MIENRPAPRFTARALVVAAVLFAGCDARKDDAPPAAAASAAASAAPASAPSAAPRDERARTADALAFADPGGDRPIDRDLRRLQQAVRRLPEKTDAWILLGQAWIRKARESADPGYYLHADACAAQVFEREPESRLAMNLRGLVLLNNHKFAEALDVADRVLQKDPDDLLALATRSDAALELGRFHEAAEAAQRMNDLKPALPSYSRASYLRWLQGDTAAAKTIIRSAITARDPRDPEPGAWVTVQAAMIFWHEGDYDGADRGFDEALKALPNYPPALVGKGRVALAKDDPARAVKWLEQAYAESPLVETAWLLGDAREAAGDAKGAEEAFAIVVKSGRQSDHRTLAQFYAVKSRDLDEALRLAEGEKTIRGDIYTDDALAWALYRKGRAAEARAASDRALSLGTKDALLLYHAGAIRIAAGDVPAGEKLVREALKLNPRFDRTGAAEAVKLVGAAK